MAEVPSRLGLFRAADGNFALPTAALLRVVEQPRLYLQGRLPMPFLGLLLNQESVVPVLLRGRAESDAQVPKYVALCSSSMGVVGFCCDQVVKLGGSDLVQFDAPETAEGRGVIGCFFYQSARYEVIDVDLLVQSLPE